MSPNPFLGVALHALGGFAAGSFYIPYKKVRGWAWETYWLVGGFFSWIIVPWIVGLLTCPNLLGVLRSASGKTALWTYLFGVMWGIGGLTFGLSMRYLGLSLGMALSLGFCAVFGTLIPPVFGGKIAGLVATTSGRIVILGIIVCLTGIAMCGRAGMRKEKELSDTEKKATIAEFSFVKGAWVAVFAGIMSSCMAFAFAAGKPIAEAAVQNGARPIFQNFPVMIVALFGGFTTNFVWCAALSVKNRSGRDYVRAKPAEPVKNAETGAVAKAPSLLINYIFSALAGTTWYFQFFFYGMGTTQMGKYDFSSWTIHMAFIITFSSLWGIYFREWRGTGTPTRRLVVAGIAVLILSTVVVGAGNYAAARAAAAGPVVAPAGELAVLETSMGTMAFELFPEDAPKTVAQFKDLVRKGFYDGKDFYRVVRGHVIQTGGGDAPKLPPEFNVRPHVFGTLGLGRTGDEWSGDSEFYVCVAARPYLDGKYTVFGRLVEGAAVLERIAVVPVEEKWEGDGARMAMHKPVQPVVIRKARMEARGAAAAGRDGSLPLVRGLVVRYFFKDPAAAERFYGRTLGLPMAGPGLFRLSGTAFLRVSPLAEAGADADAPKTATLSFVTDEVDGWYAYLRAAGLAMRSELKDASRHPTRGFVAVDPEGYLLEFERFLDDPQNSRLIGTLANAEPLGPAADAGPTRPEDLRIKASILWLYYRDLEAARLFAIDRLSAGLLVDQGFAKVMTASPTGFIGLVDGAQGLHPFTERKAVRIDLLADDPGAWAAILERRGVAAAAEGGTVAFADAGGYLFRLGKARDSTPLHR